ncbi:hypothetical protein [Frankia sp. Cr1]|uniref:AAA family ATPase n=1 Tax=Frankia sp. Cr1 TaxID=3073931 RepID=UPI002AD3495E|nr:hypothetical protein [Frankia sp. Cr1]
MLQAVSTFSQVVVATQSVPLIDQFNLDEIIIVEREDGASTFHRPDPNRLTAWLDDYSLGDLWRKNLLGGVPGSEQG